MDFISFLLRKILIIHVFHLIAELIAPHRAAEFARAAVECALRLLP